MKNIKIYTDGACSGNPGPGGWGALLIAGRQEKRISGFVANTTNNRMELQAVIEAFKLLNMPCNVMLYSDSSYVIKGMKSWVHSWKKNNWRTSGNKAVKNSDLWLELLDLVAEHEVSWLWVKGHAGDPGNEIADTLARLAIEQGLK